MKYDISPLKRVLRATTNPMTRLRIQSRIQLMRIGICNQILNKIAGQTYLEIGIYKGHVLQLVKAQRKIGIDPILTPESLRNELNIKHFSMTSDEFFAKKASETFGHHKIDVALVDGLHESRQVLRDVDGCLSHLANRGVIVLHDCNPILEPQAAATSEEGHAMAKARGLDMKVWNGDVWKAVGMLRSTRPDLQVFVLNCDYGIGIVRRRPRIDACKWTREQIENMPFTEFDPNRTEILGLRPKAYFHTFLKDI